MYQIWAIYWTLHRLSEILQTRYISLDGLGMTSNMSRTLWLLTHPVSYQEEDKPPKRQTLNSQSNTETLQERLITKRWQDDLGRSVGLTVINEQRLLLPMHFGDKNPDSQPCMQVPLTWLHDSFLQFPHISEQALPYILWSQTKTNQCLSHI